MAISDDRGAVSFRELALRVTAVAASLPKCVDTVAVAGRAGVSWIVADLAATLTGRRVVPIPPFFSSEQVSHVLTDSGVQSVLYCDPADDCSTNTLRLDSPVPVQIVDGHATVSGLHHHRRAYVGGAERVIYTSGTTGTPKGVVHGDRQMAHSIKAIRSAVGASADDVHLSSLPMSLLLEQIAGVFIPLLVGGRTHVSCLATDAAMSGDPRALLALFSSVAPTTTVLVPQLLAAMVAAAEQGGWTPPASLRFAAVGGAPIPLALVHAARTAGIAVIRGYGLSECGSVVAVERPGTPFNDIEGSCGTALDGIHIDVCDGEVVVSGPCVMDGYLDAGARNRKPIGGPDCGVWRTGDHGRIAHDGTVVILGRCDRVLVLPSGRNVAGDWLEAVVLADLRYQRARVMLDDAGALILEAVLQPTCAGWFSGAADAVLYGHLRDLFSSLPAYARPQRVLLACNGQAGEVAREIDLAQVNGATAPQDTNRIKEVAGA